MDQTLQGVQVRRRRAQCAAHSAKIDEEGSRPPGEFSRSDQDATAAGFTQFAGPSADPSDGQLCDERPARRIDARGDHDDFLVGTKATQDLTASHPAPEFGPLHDHVAALIGREPSPVTDLQSHVRTTTASGDPTPVPVVGPCSVGGRHELTAASVDHRPYCLRQVRGSPVTGLGVSLQWPPSMCDDIPSEPRAEQIEDALGDGPPRQAVKYPGTRQVLA